MEALLPRLERVSRVFRHSVSFPDHQNEVRVDKVKCGPGNYSHGIICLKHGRSWVLWTSGSASDAFLRRWVGGWSCVYHGFVLESAQLGMSCCYWISLIMFYWLDSLWRRFSSARGSLFMNLPSTTDCGLWIAIIKALLKQNPTRSCEGNESALISFGISFGIGFG